MSRQKKKALFALELVSLVLLVPSPALCFADGIVTLYGVCTAAAALIAVLVFDKLRIVKLKRRYPADGPIAVFFRVDTLELALWCIPAALIGARVCYVIFRPSYYLFDVGVWHVLCLWEGGFLLWGAVFGAVAAVLCLAKKKKADAAELLDELAAPGLFVIALCRMAEYFAGEGLGPWMENPAFMRFPFAVMNPYGEWQMAVFLFEALAALPMMAAVLRIKEEKGMRFAAALVFYACAQVVFESLRMDSCLRIGFVRVSQVLSAAVLLAVTAVRAYHAGGYQTALRRCSMTLIGAALIGGMEWAIDKTQVHNALIYGAMMIVSMLMAANALYKGRNGLYE